MYMNLRIFHAIEDCVIQTAEKIYSNLYVRVTYIYKLTINSVCIDEITGQTAVPLSS